jgi:zinc-ribbon domain
MAVAAPMRYCGRCGAPLAPGAGFCGRCGTPVLMQAAQAVPAPRPAYSYAPAPRAAYPAPGGPKLGTTLIAGGLIAVLVVVGLVVGGIAVSQLARSGQSACKSNCAPKFVTPLAEQASFRSTAYGFTVNYSSRWTVRSSDASGITLGTRVGQVIVKGVKGQSPDEAVRQTVFGLPTSQWQDITTVTTLKGAHLGEVQGVGGVYSANLIGTSQTAVKTRIGVVAAQFRDVTVVVFVADPADVKLPNGIPDGQAVDYLCTEFDWGQ